MIKNIKSNIKSGLTVSLISIPLSVSLAVASNASPLTGIITAIWAGIIAAIFGGSNFNITGPTGALSGIIATFVIANGVGNLPMLAVVTGIIVLIAYFLKFEKYLILIPSSVIHGFTLGVAFIIGLGQFNSALGLKGLPQHEKFFENVIESFRHVSEISWSAFLVFMLFLVCLFLFKKFIPKIPGAIVLAPIGILLGYLGEKEIISLNIQTLGNKFGDIAFKIFQFNQWNFSIITFQNVFQTAIIVALVAILETMLSAKIADKMTKTKYNERKEMLGLGLANIVSGLFGGMPTTAALARTSLNIKNGATHKTSAIISTFGVTIISAFFLGYFKYIPMSVIASILVYISIQMVEKEHFKKFWKYERSSFFVAFLVAIITIVEDPIFGILIGAVVSLLMFINRLSQGHFDLRLNKFEEGIVGSLTGVRVKEIDEDADVLLYSIRGNLCYVNSKAHIDRFEQNFKKYKCVILRLREVYFMDMDGIEALDEIVTLIKSRQQKVIITSIDPTTIDFIEKMSKEYSKLKAEGLIFEKTKNALHYLGVHIRENKICEETF